MLQQQVTPNDQKDIKDLIQKLQVEVPKSRWHMQRTRVINILLLGASGVGKTSLLQTLLDPTYIAPHQRLESQTREGEFHSFDLEDSESKIHYSINIIDTPGLQEQRHEIEQKKNDDELLKLAYMCVSQNITNFSLIAVVINYHSGLQDSDMNALSAIVNFIGESAVPRTILLVSKADGKLGLNEDVVFAYKKQLQERENLKPYLQACGLGVHFVGTHDPVLREKLKSKHAAIHWEESIESVSKLRDQFMELLASLEPNLIPIDYLNRVREEHDRALAELVKKKITEETTDKQKTNQKETQCIFQ